MAHDCEINTKIYYDFTDNKPTNSSVPTRDIGFSKSIRSSDCDGCDLTTENYYYDIKKDVLKKQLFFQYIGKTSYINLEIENTLINWGKFWLIFAIVIVCVLLLIVIIVFIVPCLKEQAKKQYSSNVEIPITQSTQEKQNLYNESTNKETPLVPI